MASMTKRIRRKIARAYFDPDPAPGQTATFSVPGWSVDLTYTEQVAGETFDEALERHFRRVEARK